MLTKWYLFAGTCKTLAGEKHPHMKVMILITYFSLKRSGNRVSVCNVSVSGCLFCLQPDYECDSDNDGNSSARNVPSRCNINQKRCCNVSRWLVLKTVLWDRTTVTSCGIVTHWCSFQITLNKHWLHVLLQLCINCMSGSCCMFLFLTRQEKTMKPASLWKHLCWCNTGLGLLATLLCTCTSRWRWDERIITEITN